LVFSTLHTNDGIGAVPRFLDMNAKPQILASALNAAIGQRLVRKLCAGCKKVSESADLEKIKKDLYDSPQVESVFPFPADAKIYESVGCAKCGGTGYKGRIGVYEVLFVDEAMEKLIGTSPSHQDIFVLAKKSGFITMYQDGLIRVLAGETTISEIERVISATT
jgi:type IV pilus assembly protein PilB